tara:strand:- start:708 stop:875 length:168 start_codon:yes stop_codon:yes gene_type:complete
VTQEKCMYCGENCPNEPENSEYLCDGYEDDIDYLYNEPSDQEMMAAFGTKWHDGL